jgi:hypothetical protein
VDRDVSDHCTVALTNNQQPRIKQNVFLKKNELILGKKKCPKWNSDAKNKNEP